MAHDQHHDASTADAFVDALRGLEDDGSVDRLVNLYSTECRLGNIIDGENYEGHEGVREFWTAYREQFDRISSEFVLRVGSDDGVALEWTSHAGSNGCEFTYRGMTVLETEDAKIVRSMAYFDLARLGRLLLGDDDHVTMTSVPNPSPTPTPVVPDPTPEPAPIVPDPNPNPEPAPPVPDPNPEPAPIVPDPNPEPAPIVPDPNPEPGRASGIRVA